MKKYLIAIALLLMAAATALCLTACDPAAPADTTAEDTPAPTEPEQTYPEIPNATDGVQDDVASDIF